MSTLQEKIAKALAAPDRLTARDCEEYTKAIATRFAEIKARRREIEDSPTSGPGAAMKAAGLGGSVEDVAELTREAERLTAESRALSIQRDAIIERKKAATAEEAVPRVKRAIKRLPKQLSTVEDLRAKLRKAEAKLSEITGEIGQNRATARRAGLEVPGLDEKVFARLFEVEHPGAPGGLRRERQMQLTNIKPAKPTPQRPVWRV